MHLSQIFKLPFQALIKGKQPSEGKQAVKGSIVVREDMHREPGICKTAAIQWCDPVALPHPNFRRGKVTQKISRLTWNYIHLLGLESLQNQPGLANKKMGTGLRKSHSCRDHMSIHYPPDHTVWRCYLASLAVLDILPFSLYTYSRSIRHPYGIFWNPMAHVLLLEKKTRTCRALWGWPLAYSKTCTVAFAPAIFDKRRKQGPGTTWLI